MFETDVETVSKDWLQAELRSSGGKDLLILDCRSSNEYGESHIRSAVNFSIPSILLRRLAAGKNDLKSTIKCPDLRRRIESNSVQLFILYSDCSFSGSSDEPLGAAVANGESGSGLLASVHQRSQELATSGLGADPTTNTTTINVLHRRLKQDGRRVVCLEDGFHSFRDAFPEWCEENSSNQDMESSPGTTQADQLMGLRSLRISTPHSDSACSSSAESSDCESTTHHQSNEDPVEIVPGVYLGNRQHSIDSQALAKYNIKYVLNVTSDLPNVFEASGRIQYLKIPITDHYSQDVAIHFPTAIKFIEDARATGSAVLVHCLAGVSRSVTVTLAYLMQTKALCLNDAFTLVRDRKPDVAPNFHFMQQLHSYEQQLLSSQNRTLMPNTMHTATDEDNGGLGGNSSISGKRTQTLAVRKQQLQPTF
ncbi:dual specificity protein phosphatase Mpk3 isoform X1 [Hermetia illucens]|uniref:dual specificity protein phosphatase Mpk3 isoform X1 n=1 Tax=Hermetia illucens TaxID=343691 RepID=UPI0018CC6581|nr:dual specificity protein phosphatase Mpk3 isoform X1 [Hermetia illucens]